MRSLQSLPYHWSLILLFCGANFVLGIPLTNEEDVQSDALSSLRNKYEIDSSEYVVIDDMVIMKESSRAGLKDTVWPRGVVPFSFASTITSEQRRMILQAQSEITRVVPCVTFKVFNPMRDTYNIEYRNDPSNEGCTSFIGWQNRKNQEIQLATTCSKGTIIHEINHALGFMHEHTRDDRDQYVKINMENIEPGTEDSFKKDSELSPDIETSYFDVPYNYDSIMHYASTAFSKNGENTIDVLNSPKAIGKGDNIGQRDYISEGDIQMMRRKYSC